VILERKKMAQKGAEQKFQFLMKTIQSTTSNSNDPQIVYSLIRQNLALLDDEMLDILKDWARADFSRKKESEQKIISQALIILGDTFRKLTTGNKAIQIELSIKCYSLASRVFQNSLDSDKWIEIQNSLAVAYKEKIRGDKAENLEFSIECYKFVLNAYHSKKFDLELAEAHNNLAIAYQERIRGQKNENIELSIDYYKPAQEILIDFFKYVLEFYNPIDSPTIWAINQNNLADSYQGRFLGDKAKNLELSAKYYESVLDSYGKNALFTVLSEAQYNLAEVYKQQININQLDNKSLTNLNSKLANAYYSRGVLKEYNLNDASGALDDYNKVIQLDAQNTHIYIEKSNLRKNSLNDLQQNLINYNGIIKLYPENSLTYYNRAILKQMKLDDKSGALSDYNKAIELDYQHADAYFNRGVLKHTKFDDFSGALVDYAVAIKSVLSFPERTQDIHFRWHLPAGSPSRT
jgi:tetratricopeptide (TPR) repeat protein